MSVEKLLYILKRIISTADINKNDKILEIGPGSGNLTVQIFKKTNEVINVIEIDKRLITELEVNILIKYTLYEIDF